MTAKTIKVAITGAAGQIGYALLFRIASGQMFGAETKVDLHLLELEASLPALRGVAMELEDCAFPLLQNIFYTADLSAAMREVNWAILVGSVPRKEGMERSDLLKINGNIFTAQGKAINDHAANDVRVFVVGNPCNTNCLIAMHNAPDVPRERFFAMSMLDENRAKSQLANKAGVHVSAVSNVAIFGNHSATQFPDFYHAKINGLPALEVIKDEAWLQHTFIPNVQKRGAEVIKARGLSSAASAANAVVDSVRNLTQNTPSGDCYSVCCYSAEDYYQVNGQGLIASYPCQTSNGTFKVLTGWQHNAFAQQCLKMTFDELKSERDAVQALGLIKA